VFTAPHFDWRVLLSVGVPLYVVTMTGQNLPGVAVLRNSGYEVPVSPLLGWTGAVNAVLAPFGAFGLNLAAITAAICTGEQAHPDRERRYLAAVWAGVFYLCVAALGGTIGALLTAMPRELVLGIAGIGLLGTIGGSLHTALGDERHREAAVVTFLATASGMTLLGIGSAFWGLLAGVCTLLAARLPVPGRRRPPRPVPAGAGLPGPGAGPSSVPARSAGGPVGGAAGG
jgi:benzoate membrane transport protein